MSLNTILFYVKPVCHLKLLNHCRFLSSSMVKFNRDLFPQNANILLLKRINVQLRYASSKTLLLKTKDRLYSESSPTSIFSDSDLLKLIRKLFKCSVKEASHLYEANHEILLVHSGTTISECVCILENNGILPCTIKHSFWILKCKKEELKYRLTLLKKWSFTDPNNGFGILRFPLKKLILLTEKIQVESKLIHGTNRISYFASSVQCDEKRACDLFMKYPFMMMIRLKSIDEVIRLSKGVGVLMEDVLQDMWLFRYSPQFIKRRIELLEKINAREKCKVIKPWMLRCSEATLDRYFELKDENIAALHPYLNLKDMLSKELGLSLDEVDYMIFRHAPLARISHAKAKSMIDFLKAQGFDSKMIYHVPRVLCHKQATLMGRLVELKNINPDLINLQNMCRNRKDYVAFLNKIALL